jgi:hypothetical protein
MPGPLPVGQILFDSLYRLVATLDGLGLETRGLASAIAARPRGAPLSCLRRLQLMGALCDVAKQAAARGDTVLTIELCRAVAAVAATVTE